MGEEKKNGRTIPVDFVEEQQPERSPENPEKPAAAHKGEKSSRTSKTKEDYHKKLEELQINYDALNDQFVRLRAEFANYRKRVEREQLEFSDYLKGEVIKKFLPILDDFDHMIKKSEEEKSIGVLIEGVKMIYDKFLQIFREFGVEKIEALNQDFNPQLHEAMLMQRIEHPDKNGKVIDVFQEGYVIKDRLLRPSKVIVGDYQEPEQLN